jgi:hypothetical protein
MAKKRVVYRYGDYLPHMDHITKVALSPFWTKALKSSAYHIYFGLVGVLVYVACAQKHTDYLSGG